MKNKPSAKLTDLLAEYWDVPWDEIEAARDAVLLLEEERDALEVELAEAKRKLDDADRCAVLETSCVNCAKVLEKMHGLSEELAKVRAEGAKNARLRARFEEQVSRWSFHPSHSILNTFLNEMQAALREGGES